MRQAIRQVHEALQDGETFSKALERASGLLPPDMMRRLDRAQVRGHLEQTADEIAGICEKGMLARFTRLEWLGRILLAFVLLLGALLTYWIVSFALPLMSA